MNGYLTSDGMGAIDDKLKSTVLKVTDKLGVTKYAEQLFAADGTDTGVPMAAPPATPAASSETPWLAYAVGGIAAYLLYKAIF